MNTQMNTQINIPDEVLDSPFPEWIEANFPDNVARKFRERWRSEPCDKWWPNLRSIVFAYHPYNAMLTWRGVGSTSAGIIAKKLEEFGVKTKPRLWERPENRPIRLRWQKNKLKLLEKRIKGCKSRLECYTTRLESYKKQRKEVMAIISSLNES
jgi:hypothetical protein